MRIVGDVDGIVIADEAMTSHLEVNGEDSNQQSEANPHIEAGSARDDQLLRPGRRWLVTDFDS